MHTFFVNTSKKSLNGYEVLFDIHQENKTLVSIECPLEGWNDPEKGYNACVKQMSDMIDGYAELNNAFTLIIYIDLLENEAYSSIKRDALHDAEREQCCRALHIIFTHVINGTIIQALENSGRRPQSVLIMFGEEKKLHGANVALTPKKEAVMQYFFDALGLPEVSVLETIGKEVETSYATDKMEALRAKVEAACGKEAVSGIRGSYDDTMYLWYDSIINEANVTKANKDLFDRVESIEKNELGIIGTVACPYDGFACKVNKRELALRKLNMAIYLLMCVESGTVYEDDASTGGKKVMDFRSYTVEDIAPLFKKKEWLYTDKVMEIESLEKAYSDPKIGLAPSLSILDHNKFGLDEYGDKRTELVVTDAATKSETEDGEAEDTGIVIAEGKEKEMVAVDKRGRALFTADEYKPFDYSCDDTNNYVFKRSTTPEQYIEQAKKVRRHHLDYLKKLKLNFSEVLSNYAGKSKQNKAALLRVGEKRYAIPESKDTRPLEASEVVAEKAYDTIMDQYMDFCASRSVSVTDIEEQCNSFVSRIHRISESLKKIKIVAVGIIGVFLLVYLPFVLIQFDEITQNALTTAIASASIFGPLALVYLVFTVLSIRQRKEYVKAWKEFKEKSDEMMDANKMAVQKYDQLLSTVIPALRWIYDYRLDVDYCVECCAIADAKMEHHRRKLRDRIAAIQNILSDLEFIDANGEGTQREKSIGVVLDYNSAFCSGKKNCAFYSVVDDSFFMKSKPKTEEDDE